MWAEIFFSSPKRDFTTVTHCESFLNLVLWVVCQERGKLGTGFWRHTNFSWQGKPIWSQVSWNRVVHWDPRGTGTPKDRDEVNRRDVCECDGWVCVLEVIGAPSIFKLIRKAAALVRVLPTFALSLEENAARWKWKSPLVDCASWTPEDSKKWSVSRWSCKNKSLTNSLCNLPDVLTIVVLDGNPGTRVPGHHNPGTWS